MNSKKTLLAALLAALMLTSGCGSSASQQQTDTAAQTGETGTSNVASASDMTEVEEVVEEGMTPISGDKVKDGTYSVAVKSSSKMFDITACELTVEGGKMTATMHMGGKGYLYVYMGTGEQAAAADEADYIPFTEEADGTHSFTVPVDALDEGIDCAAFSKKKESGTTAPSCSARTPCRWMPLPTALSRRPTACLSRTAPTLPTSRLQAAPAAPPSSLRPS